jgi:hypothetical protein
MVHLLELSNHLAIVIVLFLARGLASTRGRLGVRLACLNARPDVEAQANRVGRGTDLHAAPRAPERNLRPAPRAP